MTTIEREAIRQVIREELPDLLRQNDVLRREVAVLLWDVFSPLQEIRDILERWDRRAARLEEGHTRLENGHTRLEEGQFHLEQGYEVVQQDLHTLKEGQARLEEGQGRLEQRAERLEEGQGRLEQRAERLEEGQGRLEQRAERLEEGQGRLEQRAERLEEGQGRLEQRAERLEEGQGRLEQGVGRMDRRLLVLGNRWGPKNEAAVRSALQGLIAGLGYVVERFEVMDEAGQVHGVPALVEIDLVVRDGELWLVEIKGRVSGDDLYTFMRKIRFYEAHTGRGPSRRIVIAPLIEDPALARARQEGIECYSAEDELEIE
jgi:hypothetical protein